MTAAKFTQIKPDSDQIQPGGIYLVSVKVRKYLSGSLLGETIYEYAIAAYQGLNRWEEVLGYLNPLGGERQPRMWFTEGYGKGIYKIKDRDERDYTIVESIDAFCEIPELFAKA